MATRFADRVTRGRFSRAPWHLWVVGVLALIWNGFSAYDYLMTQTQNASYMAAFTPAQLDYFYGFPAWMIAFWALGVWSATAGAVLLLARSRFALTAFVLGVVGLIGASVYHLTNPAPPGVMDGAGLVITIVIFISQIALIWYARRMRDRGVLR
ncbi:hypothetical protein [Aurantiacibacter spongiae]|uniref:Sugar transporter n=1 Tax=Aurantiacibacter spongiae TaxID=2488860 RepID=A0A3N5DBF8_9SPHN|nr:hypothetical protein [Aurantiacibacter spongiae]RPF72088.1 hypothetical protein EG799_11015 [Aurantiacibacter spongiae]